MPLEKAIIVNKSQISQTVPVMFNPEEYSITKKQLYSSTTKVGSKTEEQDFLGKEEDTLSMELFFDTTDSGLDVRLYTERIVQLMKPTEEAPQTAAQKPAETNGSAPGGNVESSGRQSNTVPPKLVPPRLLFIWGSLVFDCILLSVSKKFTMFNPGGFPVRATLNVTFSGHNATEDIFSKVPLSTFETLRDFIVQQHDTLAKIADRVYGDASLWRRIAEANGIDNVRKLTPGIKLKIPKLG